MTIRIRARSASTATSEKPMPPIGGAAPASRLPQRWLARVFRNPNLHPAPDAAPDAKDDITTDALLAFGAEGEAPAAPAAVVTRAPSAKPSTDRSLQLSIASGVGLAVVAIGIAIFALVRAGWMPLAASALQPAKVRIETRPAGAELLVDGVARGTTPQTLSLAAGSHRLTLRRGSDERIVPISVTSGADASHYFELATVDAAVTRTGRIIVSTDPPGARVVVDGQLRGASPLTLADLTPSEHKVSVSTEAGSAERTVAVEAGGTTSVVFSLPKVAAPLAGWMAVAAPFDIQATESDAVIGTGKAAKIMLPAGRHEITFANGLLGYQDKRTIEIAAGKTATIKIDPPKRPINANARPWAEVFVDGTSVGQTPISNLSLPIGSHEVVFRHPQLGERQQTIVVTVPGPNRIAVDLQKK